MSGTLTMGKIRPEIANIRHRERGKRTDNERLSGMFAALSVAAADPQSPHAWLTVAALAENWVHSIKPFTGVESLELDATSLEDANSEIRYPNRGNWSPDHGLHMACRYLGNGYTPESTRGDMLHFARLSQTVARLLILQNGA